MRAGAYRERGFTLLEVVIAFAILSVSLAALYAAFEGALARTRSDNHFREATLLAQSLLTRFSIDTPDSAGMSGEWGAYRYRVTQEIVPPAHGPASTQPVMRATAHVEWTGNSGTREIAISTLALAPRRRE